jgi:tetratricopeptide (TPR) repeat protein
MSRFIAFPALALAVVSLASGCGSSDKNSTTSTSTAGAEPTVSAARASAGEEPVASAPVSYAAAESAFGGGRYADATELFTGYTVAHPENPWGYYMLGMSAWRAGDTEKALSGFDRALQLDSTHRKSLFNSSRVLLDTGHSKEALERIQKALSLEPMSSEGLRLLGRARYEEGKVEEAIEAYRRALSIDERDVWSMNNLGLIYIQQGRSDEAIPPLARAVELRGNSPVFQNNLGTALERSGYPLAAAKAYEGSIAADSSYAKAAVGLARVTGGGQQPETSGIDLPALSQQFQTQIESWRQTAAAPDSVEAVSDTVLISGGEVSDTVPEECEHEQEM